MCAQYQFLRPHVLLIKTYFFISLLKSAKLTPNEVVSVGRATFWQLQINNKECALQKGTDVLSFFRSLRLILHINIIYVIYVVTFNIILGSKQRLLWPKTKTLQEGTIWYFFSTVLKCCEISLAIFYSGGKCAYTAARAEFWSDSSHKSVSLFFHF